MATWRCPHCRTLQGDGPRCFVCQRSATSCGTCVNFRRSVVGGVGYCALDRQREPLSGEERRPCWSGTASPAAIGLFEEATQPTASMSRAAAPDRRRRNGLIEAETTPPATGS